jgi:hypothetical protein
MAPVGGRQEKHRWERSLACNQALDRRRKEQQQDQPFPTPFRRVEGEDGRPAPRCQEDGKPCGSTGAPGQPERINEKQEGGMVDETGLLPQPAVGIVTCGGAFGGRSIDGEIPAGFSTRGAGQPYEPRGGQDCKKDDGDPESGPLPGVQDSPLMKSRSSR